MSNDPFNSGKAFVRTLRLKVKAESHRWLAEAAVETNQVWNYANEMSTRAAHPFVGVPKYLSAFDLDKLAAGATKHFEHIGADTIQRVNAEFAARRRRCTNFKLRWRVSHGSKRSLGFIPFKAASLKRRGRYLRFCGKTIRVFERKKLENLVWKSGCFAQDAVGDWWLCLPVGVTAATQASSLDEVGIDLGLKNTATTSDGETLEAGHFYRGIESKIVQAQRRGHRRQAKRLHHQAARRRKDALHKFSSRLIKDYQTIVIGDVSSLRLRRTWLAKSVLDAGWGMLAVRTWICGECGDTHDRDINAARGILSAWRCSASVSGNESSPSVTPARKGAAHGRRRPEHR